MMSSRGKLKKLRGDLTPVAWGERLSSFLANFFYIYIFCVQSAWTKCMSRKEVIYVYLFIHLASCLICETVEWILVKLDIK
jgi:hypothetical protein